MNPASTPSAPSSLTPRALVLCAMIALTVGYRLLVHFVPGLLPWNFTPVAAMALFGGAYFADRRLALLMPLMAMLVADAVIALALPAAQLHSWMAMAPVIYGCIALTAFGGFALRGRVKTHNVALAAVGSATGFYLVTNFAVWALSPLYVHSLSGLASCYVAALPFYQYGTLPGTVLWSAALFGGFALLSRRYRALELAPTPA